MTYSATVVQIMIASPTDIEIERNIIREVIHEWNAVQASHYKTVLLTVSWETHASPEMGDRGQGIINKQLLEDSDILVAVFWTRLGTPTGKEKSGTVEEIKEHHGKGKPTMIYFSGTPVELKSVDTGQYNELLEFKKWCMENGLIHEYSNPSEFKNSFQRHLTQKIISEFSEETKDSKTTYPVDIESKIPADLSKGTEYELSKEAEKLLLEASNDPQGTILTDYSIGGIRIYTNVQNIVHENNPLDSLKWENAIDELINYGLLVMLGIKGKIFTVTSLGYQYAHKLTSQNPSA